MLADSVLIKAHFLAGRRLPFGLEGAGEAEPGVRWALCRGSLFLTTTTGGDTQQSPRAQGGRSEMSKEGLLKL